MEKGEMKSRVDFKQKCGYHFTAYCFRTAGIKYSANDRSKSYFGCQPQSVRAAKSSTSAGQLSIIA
jgi:hypothetical protein